MRITELTSEVFEAEERNLGSLVSGIICLAGGVGALAYGLSSQRIPWWIGLILIALGAILILLHRATLVHLDKNSNTAMIYMSSILKKSTINCALADIRHVQLISAYTTNQDARGSSSTTLTTRLVLITANGQFADLSDRQTGMGNMMLGFGKVPNQDIANKLAAFLGLPLETVGPTGIGNLVQNATQRNLSPNPTSVPRPLVQTQSQPNDTAPSAEESPAKAIPS